jgi:membrane-associated phospholipid phosphatase
MSLTTNRGNRLESPSGIIEIAATRKLDRSGLNGKPGQTSDRPSGTLKSCRPASLVACSEGRTSVIGESINLHWPFSLRGFAVWCATFVAVAILVSICMNWLDAPIAQFFIGNFYPVLRIGRVFDSRFVIFAEATLVISFVVIRLMRGKLPDLAWSVIFALSASIFAFIVTDIMLKKIFGRPTPIEFVYGGIAPALRFLQGNAHSSFPSGHMAGATAFLTTLLMLYPQTRPTLMLLIWGAAAVLVIGDTHFLSDVVAGAFVGATAGVIAAGRRTA